MCVQYILHKLVMPQAISSLRFSTLYQCISCLWWKLNTMLNFFKKHSVFKIKGKKVCSHLGFVRKCENCNTRWTDHYPFVTRGLTATEQAVLVYTAIRILLSPYYRVFQQGFEIKQKQFAFLPTSIAKESIKNEKKSHNVINVHNLHQAFF